MPFTGQLNLLTTGSFDSPKELFTPDNFSRSIAYFSLAAPVARTGGLVDAWRADPGRYLVLVHRRGVRDARCRRVIATTSACRTARSDTTAAIPRRCAKSPTAAATSARVYGFDTFTLTPAVAVTYGARFSRYDYLAASMLFSPRVELTLSPGDHFRLNALGVEPRPRAGRGRIPAADGHRLVAAAAADVLVDRRGTAAPAANAPSISRSKQSAISARPPSRCARSASSVDDQLVTMFGPGRVGPGAARAQLGHYFVGNTGDVDATGWGAGFRTTLVSRVHGSVEYSMTRARWTGTADGRRLYAAGGALGREAASRSPAGPVDVDRDQACPKPRLASS